MMVEVVAYVSTVCDWKLPRRCQEISGSVVTGPWPSVPGHFKEVTEDRSKIVCRERLSISQGWRALLRCLGIWTLLSAPC